MWRDLREGLPEIYGWTITEELPDLEAIGATYVDWIEVDEGPPWSVIEYGERPTKDLAEYRYRLSRARRQAVRGRLKQLVDFVEVSLPSALEDVDRQSRDRLESPDFDELRSVLGEVDRLVGDTVERRGRWVDLNRHLQAWLQHSRPSVRRRAPTRPNGGGSSNSLPGYSSR